jgi:hypothetical protein
MQRECPQCGSSSVRRSRTQASADLATRILRARYRCESCRRLFWAFSTQGHRLAVVSGIVAGLALLGIATVAVVEYQRSALTAPPLEAWRIEATAGPAWSDHARDERDAAEFVNLAGKPPEEGGARIAQLERAAAQGNVHAQYELGVALRDGQGMAPDHERAATWLRRAAELGDGLAQYELGLLYRSGSGVTADNGKAYMWLTLAAAQGIERAHAARDMLRRQLLSAETDEARTEAKLRAER